MGPVPESIKSHSWFARIVNCCVGGRFEIRALAPGKRLGGAISHGSTPECGLVMEGTAAGFPVQGTDLCALLPAEGIQNAVEVFQ